MLRLVCPSAPDHDFGRAVFAERKNALAFCPKFGAAVRSMSRLRSRELLYEHIAVLHGVSMNAYLRPRVRASVCVCVQNRIQTSRRERDKVTEGRPRLFSTTLYVLGVDRRRPKRRPTPAFRFSIQSNFRNDFPLSFLLCRFLSPWSDNRRNEARSRRGAPSERSLPRPKLRLPLH